MRTQYCCIEQHGKGESSDEMANRLHVAFEQNRGIKFRSLDLNRRSRFLRAHRSGEHLMTQLYFSVYSLDNHLSTS